MITSKRILQLVEDYFDSKNVAGQLVTVFENPAKSEFRELERESRKSGGGNILRFIADGNSKKMYVWDAYNARHVDVRKMLNLPPNFEDTPSILDGYLEVSGGSAKMFAWEDIQFYLAMYKNKKSKKLDSYFSKVFMYRWTWMDKYADCSRFIFNQQMDFEDKIMGDVK